MKNIWQLFRSFLYEWRTIQRTAACLLRDLPGVIRGEILRILQQLCNPDRIVEKGSIASSFGLTVDLQGEIGEP
jgi:hypothetical protein